MNKDEILLKSYTINSKDYLVINEADYNGIHYLYLSNEENPKDMMLRKVIEGYLEPLDTEEEILEVLKLIAK